MANIEELLKNKEFTDKLEQVDSTKAILSLFEEYGIEMTEEELKESFAYVQKQKNGELDTDDLENVSGGGSWSTFLKGTQIIDSVYDWVGKKTGIWNKWNRFING